MSSTPAEEYVLVESDGTIFGVLATADVDRAFEEGAAQVNASTASGPPEGPADWSGVRRGPLRAR